MVNGNNVVIDLQDLSYIKEMVSRAYSIGKLQIPRCASRVSRSSRSLFGKVESIVCVDF